MTQSESCRCWELWLASSLVIGVIITSSGEYALAQIKPDSSLGVESSQVTSKSPGAFLIDGGATRGTNLFHSFSQFSVPTNGIAYFNNAPNIQNIISRVTSASISNIDGLIKANGAANLFLINPNGIIFGTSASLKIGGSFVASTASSLKFADGTQFSATAPQTKPLLTINVPIGLQFGESAGAILVQGSRSAPGLVVNSGQTLGLLGGDVTLEGGHLKAPEGRIELGSVASNSLVKLNPTVNGWFFGYEGVQNFQNIQLTQGSFHRFGSVVDASGNGGGDIHLQGRQVTLTDYSQILSTTDEAGPGGNLTVNASESVLINHGSVLSSATTNVGEGGNITINTERLLLGNGATVSTESAGEQESSGQITLATGRGGNLTVNASKSVELMNGSLSSNTQNLGNGGDITLNTGRLLLRDGGQISTSTFGEGQGGKLTVNASESVELSGGNSGLFSSTQAAGGAGDIRLATGNLTVRDGAAVDVSSEGAGTAGNLKITARSILLDNRAVLSAETKAGQGNINLGSQDLLLRRGSSITSSATGTATGGNITIKTGVLTALENSDISATSQESFGGRVMINAQGIFRSRESDITATSALGPKFSGTVQINTLVNNPSFGLVNLPVQPVDVKGLIAQGCPADVGPRASKFVVTGRGGLPPTPREALRSEPTLVDLGTTVPGQENHASAEEPSNPTNSEPAPLVEATGWVTNDKGEVVLVAQAPTVTLDIPWLTPTTCHAQ